MVFDPRSTKQQGRFEEKSSTLSIQNDLIAHGLSFPEFLSNGGLHDLSAFAAIQLYRDAMPLFNAVDMRATAFSQIPIKVWDKKAKEFIDHDSLALLEQPNADTSGMEFLEQVSNFYDITGNSFIFAGGRISKPPLELAIVPSQNITFDKGTSKFGILHVPDFINVTTMFQGRERFQATEENQDLGLRFISTNTLEDRELWHIRTFNPLRSVGNFWGMSRVKPIWFELQQYLAGNNTNLSMLKRGTKLSLAWVNNRGEELTDKQWDRLQEEATKYAGDTKVGGTPILDGMDVKTIGQSNRDMEFKDLQEAMLGRVSLVFRIPLALLLDKSMTMNNLKTSMPLFFDNSIIPHAKRIYSELTRFILPRYKNSEDLEYRFSPNEIPALQARIIDTVKSQSEIQVNTSDELRAILGDETLPEGGDVVLIDSTKIPLGSEPIIEEGFPQSKSIGNHFIELLERDGYGHEEANELAIERGLK